MIKPKRIFLTGLLLVSVVLGYRCRPDGKKEAATYPNVIIVFADDLGYGDLGCYGHPTIRTPHLDRMATEGQRWTSFYSAASVCTPSRAGLLTGRLPVRSGMAHNQHRVLFPNSAGGLAQTEITLARALKERDYKTACIGKWHLGHLPEYLPARHGFDYYFGIPYSNDMDRQAGISGFEASYRDPKIEYFNVPLMRNEEIIERPADQHTITRRYAQEAVRFIEENAAGPFFVYLAHSMPHVPLFTSDDFRGTSLRGLYGDVLAEIDWGMGEIMKTLEKLGISDNTLLIFTSDNGPWLVFREAGGSAGLLREGKGTAYEGGMRVPAIFHWPGTIRPDVITGLGSTLDLFPTVLNLAGLDLPQDRTYDGFDLGPVLNGATESPRTAQFFYEGTRLFAVREGAWKLHFRTREGIYTPEARIDEHDPPLLFNLHEDPSEKYDLAAGHPEIVQGLSELASRHEATVELAEDQMARWIDAP